jgi:acyl carrier protein
VQPEQVLDIMKAYLVDDQPDKPLDNFPRRLPSEFLEDSVDVLTFVMHLEEKLHVDIPLAKVGPALSQMTFQDLAGELCKMSPTPGRG